MPRTNQEYGRLAAALYQEFCAAKFDVEELTKLGEAIYAEVKLNWALERKKIPPSVLAKLFRIAERLDAHYAATGPSETPPQTKTEEAPVQEASASTEQPAAPVVQADSASQELPSAPAQTAQPSPSVVAEPATPSSPAPTETAAPSSPAPTETAASTSSETVAPASPETKVEVKPEAQAHSRHSGKQGNNQKGTTQKPRTETPPDHRAAEPSGTSEAKTTTSPPTLDADKAPQPTIPPAAPQPPIEPISVSRW